jgi:hypothetical protein
VTSAGGARIPSFIHSDLPVAKRSPASYPHIHTPYKFKVR